MSPASLPQIHTVHNLCRRHISSSSSGSSESQAEDSRSWDSCSISRRSSSRVLVFRHAGGSSLVIHTFAWGAGFFWRRSGQSLLKCPTRRQRKHLVLLRICSMSGAGVWEPELWLKLNRVQVLPRLLPGDQSPDCLFLR